jgi:hypothetical protein
MGKIFNMQSNLNRGELAPSLVGRNDLESYYSGLRKATNVVCLPQGGVSRRSGTVYVDDFDVNSRLESFSFNDEVEYLLVFYPLRMYIYKSGVLQTNISGSGNDYLTTTITAGMLNSFDYTQSADTVIICHADLPTQEIARTSDTAWTISTIPFTDAPQYNFNDASSPSPTSEIQNLAFSSASTGDRYKLSVDSFLTDEIVYSSSTSDNAEAIRSALQDLPNMGNDGILVAFLSGSTYTVTFAGDSAFPHGLIIGYGVVTKNSSFSANGTRTQTGVSKAESAWSATRGYPISSTFHGNRLWIGGSKSLPTTLWASNIGDYYDFDKGKSRDDESIQLFLDTDQLNAIRHVVSNKKLQVFTTGQHFYIPEDVITPSTVSVRSISNEGAGIASPVILDNDILYSNRTGKRLNIVTISNQYQPTETRNIAVLAPHLVSNPVQMAASKGTSSDDANYIYVVNSDGGMTILNTLTTEGVEGFSSWATEGDIKSVAIVDDTLYMLVYREGKGANGDYFLEKADNTVYFDCSEKGSGTSLSMSHLDSGVIVYAKGDGYSLGSSSTFSSAYTELQAGLKFTTEVKTMPINFSFGNGSTVSRKKRLVRCFLRLLNSAGIIVNGKRVRDRLMDSSAFSPPELFTGQKEVSLRGYSLDADVTITQDLPFDMTILSINTEVSV